MEEGEHVVARQRKEMVIPALTLKSGIYKYKQNTGKKNKDTNCAPDRNDCAIVYEEGSSKLYFKVIDQKHFIKTGEKKLTTLECIDISAADLKVTSKFGSWDSISCRLLIECTQPLVSWTVQKLSEVQGLRESKNEEDANGDQNSFVRNVQESCMVKATFEITDLPKVRDLLHSLKVSKLRDRKVLQEKHKKGVDKHIRIPSKIREGLPEWVNYIPAKWYSTTIRQVFEYILVIYTILTLTWAIWQLYKHVGFIRNLLRPFLDIIELYLEILRNWFRWLDQFADIITNYWWMYMKPVYLLVAPLYTVLAQFFKPLRNVAGVITALTQPIVSMFRVVLSTFKPFMKPLVSLFNVFYQTFQKFIGACVVAWNMIARTAVIRMVVDRLQGMGIHRFMHEVSQGGLDPLKMQLIIVRDVLTRSTKQIYYGLRFIFQRLYYMSVFVKRERDYAREEETAAKEKGE